MLTRASIVAALLLVTASAEAQYLGPQQIRPTRSALWGELGFYTGELPGLAGLLEAEATVFSPLIEGYFGIGDSLAIDFAWGFGQATVSWNAGPIAGEESEGGLVVGNPFFGASFVSRSRNGVLRVGGGATVPAVDAEGAGKTLAWQIAMAMRGLWDLWLWWPDRLTVVPSARYDGRSGSVEWAVEGAMGLMFYTGDGDQETEVPLQVAGEIGARLSKALVLGGRLQTWFLPTGEDDQDNAQVAVEPFVRVEGEHVFGFARFTINLDDPWGFAFDDDGVWGLRLGGGARF